MKMSNLVLCSYLVLFFLLISCHQSEKKQDNQKMTSCNADFTILQLDEAERKAELKMSSIFSVAKPIELEITDSSVIGKINKLSVYNNKIIVFDRLIAKSIFVFDMNGHFLYRIGRLGEVDNPEHTHPLSGNKSRIQKESIFSLNPDLCQISTKRSNNM